MKIFRHFTRRERISFDGFTLLELLLGLSIFAVIAVCVYGTFSNGIQLSRRAQYDNKIYHDVQLSIGLMANELENMVGYDFSNSYKDRSSVVGEEDRITFILPTQLGLRVISYYIDSPPKANIHKTIIGQTYSKNVKTVLYSEERLKTEDLFRKERSFADYLNSDEDKNAEVEVVATNIKANGLKFSYGYLEGEDTKKILWKNTWAYNYIPSDIRIAMDFVSENAKNKTITIIKSVLIPAGFLGSKDSEVH